MHGWLALAGVFRALLFCVYCGCHAGQKWPQISEAKMNFHFVSEKREEFSAVIYEVGGAAAYYLDCKFNAWKYDQPDYSFSGMLDCRLLPAEIGDESASTLFQNVAPATRDWESGGRFTGDELLAASKFGASGSIVRKFRLRGMRVVLEVADIVTESSPASEIKALDLTVVISRDPSYIFLPIERSHKRWPTK